MEVSHRAGWRKWVVLAVVIVLLALWFVLSSGTENYRGKYAGVDLDKVTGDIGRGDTYAAYLLRWKDVGAAKEDVQVDVLSASPRRAFPSTRKPAR